MIERFTGESGERKLVEALVQQEIVAGDRPLASRLASLGRCVQIEPGASICEQGGGDDDVFFLINGTVDVIVNGHIVSTRTGGQTVGELAAIDASERRSATARANSRVIALQLSSEQFQDAGADSAGFWRHLSRLTATRLREREKFHIAANPTPIMFVGSSVEGLEVARSISSGLKHDNVIVRLWTTKGVFGPSQTSIDDILIHADEADFALFVFGPDDKTRSRNTSLAAPRDNVVFELGLFLGRIGRDRVFMARDADADLKIPSDLLGINPLTYKVKEGGTLDDAIETVCNDLRAQFSAKGVVTNRMDGVTGRVQPT